MLTDQERDWFALVPRLSPGVSVTWVLGLEAALGSCWASTALTATQFCLPRSRSFSRMSVWLCSFLLKGKDP